MSDFKDYYRLNASTKFSKIDFPVPYKVKLSESDKSNGVIIRYFAKMSNDVNSEIFEISKQNYQNLKAVSLYRTIEIPWLIRGNIQDVVGLRETGEQVTIRIGVKTANQNTIRNAEREFSSLSSIVNDPLQFYMGV